MARDDTCRNYLIFLFALVFVGGCLSGLTREELDDARDRRAQAQADLTSATEADSPAVVLEGLRVELARANAELKDVRARAADELAASRESAADTVDATVGALKVPLGAMFPVGLPILGLVQAAASAFLRRKPA